MGDCRCGWRVAASEELVKILTGAEGGEDGVKLWLTKLYDLAEVMGVAFVFIWMVGMLRVFLRFFLSEVDGSFSAFSLLLLFL